MPRASARETTAKEINVSRVCRNALCGALIHAEALRKRPQQVYCDRQCQLTDPAQHERLRALLVEENARRKATGIDPAHGGEAAIAASNRANPRRKRRPGSRFVSKSLREAVKARCGYQCSYCARGGTVEKDPDGEAWHIEHVVPVERGGPTHAENLTLACRRCNLAKGTRPAFRFAVTRSLM